MIDLTQVIVYILSIVLPALLGWLTIETRKWLKAKEASEHLQLLEKWAGIAVYAAEQMAAQGKINGEAINKFKVASGSVNRVLAQHNIKYDAETIREAIESYIPEINEIMCALKDCK